MLSFREYINEGLNKLSAYEATFKKLDKKEQIVFLSIVQRKSFARLDFVNSSREGNLNMDKAEFDSVVASLLKKNMIGKGYKLPLEVKKAFSGGGYRVRNGEVEKV